MLVGLLTSSPDAASGYGFALLFLPYVSSAFAPVDSLPGWLQPFARHQPLTPLIESLRSLLSGGAAPDASRAVAWCLGITALATVSIAVSFPRRSTRAR